MNRKLQTTKFQLRLTGKSGQIDGAMEMIIGMFVMTGVLVHSSDSVTVLPDGTVKIYVDMEILTPPLGNLGERGMVTYTGDNP